MASPPLANHAAIWLTLRIIVAAIVCFFVPYVDFYGGSRMQTLLIDCLALCCNIALIFLLTLLIVTPLWSPAFRIACCVAVLTLLIATPLWNPAFKIVCCVAAAWPVCFIYVILATRSGHSGLQSAGFGKEATRLNSIVPRRHPALLRSGSS
jgi:glycerol-3-phosphate acyltransferase PlsY